MRRFFRDCVLGLVCATGCVGCISPREGGDATATARTISEAAAEVGATVEQAFADVLRRRVSAGVSPDEPMTVQEWVTIGLQVAAVVSQYAASFQVRSE